jgi:oligopeptide transport system ATP-binding protein
MRVGVSVADSLRFHGVGTGKEREQMTRGVFGLVGLHSDQLRRFPNELSGGQNQRVAIARALILRPELVVLDEPVSALDASIRAQVLRLLRELQGQFNLTYVFISHDISAAKRISNWTAVPYLGKVVEYAKSDKLYRQPLHPYTQALIKAIPSVRSERKSIDGLIGLEGDAPDPTNLPRGCRFNARCPYCMSACREQEPTIQYAGGGHFVACLLYE